MSEMGFIQVLPSLASKQALYMQCYVEKFTKFQIRIYSAFSLILFLNQNYFKIAEYTTSPVICSALVFY